MPDITLRDTKSGKTVKIRYEGAPPSEQDLGFLADKAFGTSAPPAPRPVSSPGAGEPSGTLSGFSLDTNPTMIGAGPMLTGPIAGGTPQPQTGARITPSSPMAQRPSQTIPARMQGPAPDPRTFTPGFSPMMEAGPNYRGAYAGDTDPAIATAIRPKPVKWFDTGAAEDPAKLAAIGRNAADSAIPVTAGIAVTSPLLKGASFLPGPLKALGYLGALGIGAGVSAGASYLQDAARRQYLSPELNAQIDERLQQDQQQFPAEAMIGRNIPLAATQKFGFPLSRQGLGMAAGGAVMNAGIDAGMQVGENVFNGRPAFDLDYGRLGEQAVVGAAFPGPPTKFGKAIEAPIDRMAKRYLPRDMPKIRSGDIRFTDAGMPVSVMESLPDGRFRVQVQGERVKRVVTPEQLQMNTSARRNIPEAPFSVLVRDQDTLASALQMAFGVDQATAKADAERYDAEARSWSARSGKPVEEYYKRIGVTSGDAMSAAELKAPENSRGAIDKVDDKMVIVALNAPDATTARHELGHNFLEMLPPEEQGLVAQWATGGRSNALDELVHERFARAFEDWRQGNKGAGPVAELFQRFGRYLADIYDRYMIGQGDEKGYLRRFRYNRDVASMLERYHSEVYPDRAPAAPDRLGPDPNFEPMFQRGENTDEQAALRGSNRRNGGTSDNGYVAETMPGEPAGLAKQTGRFGFTGPERQGLVSDAYGTDKNVPLSSQFLPDGSPVGPIRALMVPDQSEYTTTKTVNKKQPDGKRTPVEETTKTTENIVGLTEQYELVPVSVLRLATKDQLPDYLYAVRDFIRDQRRKFDEGTLTTRDVAKAYIMTKMSIQAAAIRPEKIAQKIGHDVPPGYKEGPAGLVRPEHAGAAFLGSPEGQTALNNIEQGIFNKDDWKRFVDYRASFGNQNSYFNEIAGPLKRGEYNLNNLSDFTAELNRLRSLPDDQAKNDAFHLLAERLNGIGFSKTSFFGHFLGFGDHLTPDAREINFMLGGVPEAPQFSPLQKFVKDVKGNDKFLRVFREKAEQKVRDLVAQTNLGRDLDPNTLMHVMHHLIWDGTASEITTHRSMMMAQRFFQRPESYHKEAMRLDQIGYKDPYGYKQGPTWTKTDVLDMTDPKTGKLRPFTALIGDRTKIGYYEPIGGKNSPLYKQVLLYGGPGYGMKRNWKDPKDNTLARTIWAVNAGRATRIHNSMAGHHEVNALIVVGSPEQATSNQEFYRVFGMELDIALQHGLNGVKANQTDVDKAVGKIATKLGLTGINTWTDYVKEAPSMSFEERAAFIKALGAPTLSKTLNIPSINQVLDGFIDHHDASVGDIVAAGVLRQFGLPPTETRKQTYVPIPNLNVHISYPYALPGVLTGSVNKGVSAHDVFSRWLLNAIAKPNQRSVEMIHPTTGPLTQAEEQRIIQALFQRGEINDGRRNGQAGRGSFSGSGSVQPENGSGQETGGGILRSGILPGMAKGSTGNEGAAQGAPAQASQTPSVAHPAMTDVLFQRGQDPKRPLSQMESVMAKGLKPGMVIPGESKKRYRVDAINGATASITVMDNAGNQIGRIKGANVNELSRALIADRKLRVAAELNLPMSVMSSLDISAPGRQGLWLGAANLRLAGKAFGAQMKNLVSQQSYEQWQKDLLARPNNKSGLYDEVGLRIATGGEGEDAYLSEIAKRLGFVNASERAYVTYLDQLRADVFDSFVAGTGLKPGQKPDDAQMKALQDVAWWVNNASGKGKIPERMKAANALANAVMFSPSFASSRVAILMSPAKYGKLDPMVRKQIGQQMAQSATMILGAMMLAKASGAQISLNEEDPDFLKVKYGKFSYDFSAGVTQYIRFLLRFGKRLTGQNLGQNVQERQSAGQVATRFLRGKLSPNASLAVDALYGKDYGGEPINFAATDPRKNPIGSRLIPLPLQDMTSFYEAEGMMGVLKGAPSVVGIGVNAREDRPSRGGSSRSSGSGVPMPPMPSIPKIPMPPMPGM